MSNQPISDELIRAIEIDDYAEAEKLLDSGISANSTSSSGSPALVNVRNVRMAELMLDRGADLRTRSDAAHPGNLVHRATRGITYSIIASSREKEWEEQSNQFMDLLRFATSRGLSINDREAPDTYGITPLMRWSSIQFSGDDYHPQCYHQYEVAGVLFLELGADLEMTTNTAPCKTALDMARNRIAKSLLKSRGARSKPFFGSRKYRGEGG
ncbi:MAG: hypothetical protein AAF585_20260 [Verrucomicrobiota bacterium]